MRTGRPGQVKWNREQDQMIKDLYPTLGSKKLSEQMGVPNSCLMNRAYYLGVKFLRNTVEWTEEMISMIREKYAAMGPTLLAKEMGISYDALVGKSRELKVGLTRSKPTAKKLIWTEEILGAIRERFEKEGPDLLSLEIGFKPGAIHRKANELGLKTNVGHARWGQERAEKNESVNIHFFDSWNPDMAYVLGFLFADGSVNKEENSVCIRITREDEKCLVFIQNILKSKRPIYREKGRGKDKDQSILGISSTVMVSKLIDLGLKPRKTYNDDPFPNIPKGMISHFVRGYFDGDGSVGVYGRDCCHLSFVGSPRFLVGLRNLLVNTIKVSPKSVGVKKGKTADWASVYWSAKDDILKFQRFLYPEGYSFCYERKKKRLDKWIKDQESK